MRCGSLGIGNSEGFIMNLTLDIKETVVIFEQLIPDIFKVLRELRRVLRVNSDFDMLMQTQY